MPCGKACKCENCHNKAPEGEEAEEEPEQSLPLQLPEGSHVTQVSWDPLKAPPQLVIPPLPGATTAQCVRPPLLPES